MSNAEKKLIELLNGGELEAEVMCSTQEDCDKCPNARNGCQERTVAEYLLANVVIVQEWVPVSEPPEEYRDKYRELIPFLVCEKGTEYPFRAFYDGKTWGDGLSSIYPTHWMKLPEPPKGE